MKRGAILFALLIVGTLTVFAGSDPVSTKVQALNMSEVIENITYPIASRQQAVEGRVVVLLDINEMGEVTKNKVIIANCPKLAAAVEKEIQNLKFSPATDKNGQAIATTVKLPIDFELEVN
ncbi:MAG: energy transducer TonB [Cyclobacteriaceae bacterium]